MLILNDEFKISHGKTRICYAHPVDPAFVVKTAFEGDSEGELSNIREMQAYQNLIRKYSDLSCISKCYAFVSTNRGKGLLCQCIRNHDGSIAKTIWDILLYDENCDIHNIERVVEKFSVYLRRHDVFIFDLNLKNIALQVQKNRSYHPYIIDFKSHVDTKEFIPLTKYSKYFSRKKLVRRTNQLMSRVKEYYEKRAELIVRDRNNRALNGF